MLGCAECGNKTYVLGCAEYDDESGCCAIDFYACYVFKMAHDGNGSGADGAGYSLIPQWDGAPQGWRRYRDDVEIWALGTNLEVNYCVAARLVSRLKGAARRVGLRIPRRAAAAAETTEPPSSYVASRALCGCNCSRGILRPTR